MSFNRTSIVYPSAARTATPAGIPQSNHSARGVVLILDITATPNNAETLTPSIQAIDEISGKAVTLTAFTALTASALGAAPTTATFAYTLDPAGAETAAVANHEVQSLGLPLRWQPRVTHSSTGSWTYSLSCQYLA